MTGHLDQTPESRDWLRRPRKSAKNDDVPSDVREEFEMALDAEAAVVGEQLASLLARPTDRRAGAQAPVFALAELEALPADEQTVLRAVALRQLGAPDQ